MRPKFICVCLQLPSIFRSHQILLWAHPPAVGVWPGAVQLMTGVDCEAVKLTAVVAARLHGTTTFLGGHSGWIVAPQPKSLDNHYAIKIKIWIPFLGNSRNFTFRKDRKISDLQSSMKTILMNLNTLAKLYDNIFLPFNIFPSFSDDVYYLKDFILNQHGNSCKISHEKKKKNQVSMKIQTHFLIFSTTRKKWSDKEKKIYNYISKSTNALPLSLLLPIHSFSSPNPPEPEWTAVSSRQPWDGLTSWAHPAVLPGLRFERAGHLTALGGHLALLLPPERPWVTIIYPLWVIYRCWITQLC